MPNFVFISPHFPDTYWKFCISLRNHGFIVLGIGDAPYNEIGEACKFSLNEYYCCAKMEDYENEKRAVKYYIDKYGPITFLESNNEYWLTKDAELRTDFHITSGVDVEGVKLFRSKIRQKEVFEKNGIKCARFTADNSKEGILAFAKKVGFPIFAKPDDGVGAQGTMKIKNEEDVNNFISVRDQNKKYIIEEFVEGDIISFDGVANSRSDVIFATEDVFTVNNADIVNNDLDDMYYCNPFMDHEFYELGCKVVSAAKIKQRFFHIEFFVLTKDHPYLGKKGTRIPLEINCRPAGGYTPDVINFANSLSCYDIYADCLAFDENRQNMNQEKFYCVACSRRFKSKYVYEFSEVLDKYKYAICMYGDYPEVLRDDMGDCYAIAKFKTMDELYEFDRFVREKSK
jgi:hypothetical protein